MLCLHALLVIVFLPCFCPYWNQTHCKCYFQILSNLGDFQFLFIDVAIILIIVFTSEYYSQNKLLVLKQNFVSQFLLILTYCVIGKYLERI